VSNIGWPALMGIYPSGHPPIRYQVIVVVMYLSLW